MATRPPSGTYARRPGRDCGQSIFASVVHGAMATGAERRPDQR